MGRFLRAEGTGDVTSTNVSNISISLPAGNVNSSNMVDVDDFSAVLGAYNTSVYDEAGSIAEADVDGSGTIDVESGQYGDHSQHRGDQRLRFCSLKLPSKIEMLPSLGARKEKAASTNDKTEEASWLTIHRPTIIFRALRT